MPHRSALQLRAGLSKAQSSILTQVRTGKIGLAAFLCKRQVPNYPTPACSCGAQWETAKHVVIDCPRLQRARRSLYAAASTTDFQAMISRPRPAAALTAWILRHGVLSQFSWAQEQLDTGYQTVTLHVPQQLDRIALSRRCRERFLTPWGFPSLIS